mmetsp:Transcript_1730/g.4335  ORF Transcript_1730/g.4335 Transcript_1730/m.4335 type:complete len:285 (-) Transcript_1730:2552-3406(-)
MELVPVQVLLAVAQHSSGLRKSCQCFCSTVRCPGPKHHRLRWSWRRYPVCLPNSRHPSSGRPTCCCPPHSSDPMTSSGPRRPASPNDRPLPNQFASRYSGTTPLFCSTLPPSCPNHLLFCSNRHSCPTHLSCPIHPSCPTHRFCPNRPSCPSHRFCSNYPLRSNHLFDANPPYPLFCPSSCPAPILYLCPTHPSCPNSSPPASQSWRPSRPSCPNLWHRCPCLPNSCLDPKLACRHTSFPPPICCRLWSPNPYRPPCYPCRPNRPSRPTFDPRPRQAVRSPASP